MTRETKIGLVVAGSFLCLVCVVVASKWKRGDDAAKEPELQEIKLADVTPKHDAKPVEQKPNDSAKNTQGRSGERQPDKGAPQPLPPMNAINPKKSDAQVEQEIRDAQKKSETVPVGAVTLPTPPLPQPSTSTPNPFLDAKPIVLDPKGPALPAPPLESGGGLVFKPLDGPPEKKNGGVTIPNPEGPRPVVGAIDIGQGDPLPKPPALPPLGKEPAPFVAKDPLPAFPPVAKDPVPAFPPVAKDPAPVFPPVAKDPAPVIPKDPVPAFPPVAKDPIPAFPPVAKGPIPAFPPVAKDPAPLIPKDPLPAFPPVARDPSPIIPKEAIPAIAPIIVPGAKPALQVAVTDDYECQRGDSTFAILSMRFYGTEKYADALQAYNRTHSAMIRGGSNLNINPPILAQGQKVLNPSKDLLDRDYRLYISDTPRVNPPPAGPSIPPTIKITTPTPLAPPGGVATAANPPAGGVYRVQNPNGESILDIAERTLGNRSRWTAIYDLNRANPAVQPQFRIPAGTELKLPAN